VHRWETTGHPPAAVTVARADTPHGEVALRRRGEALELVVDGAFAMDTVDTSTEVLLAEEALRRHPAPRRVLVGGLGLGFTARSVLADGRVAHVDVVELAEPLVEWAREGVAPELAGIEGPRCSLHVADVVEVLAAGAGPTDPADPTGPTGPAGPSGPWDVVVLDVDNGPGFLVHAHNADLYAVPGLAAARAALAPGGVLVVWSSHVAPELLAALGEVAGPSDDVAETVVPVEREGRAFDYAIYSLVRRDGILTG
jgi:spermidine synthase